MNNTTAADNKLDKIILSIIIPIYNSEKYLKDCLNSILNINIKRYEVICVDDGSVDNSSYILNEFKNKFDDFIIIKQNHQGLSVARNTGMEFARGEYLYFVDSDDLIKANFIEEALNVACKEMLDVFLFSFENFCNDEVYEKYKTRILKKKRTFQVESIVDGKSMLRIMLEKEEYYPMVWIQLVKRKFLLENNLTFREGILFEDAIYTFQLLWNAKRVRLVKNIGYKKRLHTESICGRPESVHNVVSLWDNYKSMITLCDNYYQEDDNYEYIAKKMIYRSISQLMLHYGRLVEKDKKIFIDNLHRWDKIKFDFLISNITVI